MREFRFVLTPFCNYKCFFCHSENICEQMNLILKPCDYEFLAETAKQYFGWNTCTITGGEPLISPIFKDTCERLKSKGIKITVVSNGSLLARPREMLKDIAQLNVSLHTMNPMVYEKIIGVKYPLRDSLNTIRKARRCLPELVIHLNYTVIKGMNDSDDDFEQFLEFARSVDATAKFIDLSSSDKNLATDAEEIVLRMQRLGFRMVNKDAWQFHLDRMEQNIIVTKCPFNGKHTSEPIRDVFVDSNGTLYTSYSGKSTVNALEEIHSHNVEGLVHKIKVLLN